MPSSQKTQKIESLNSWKEISLYLDRGVRTVQRWERELGLPVHRVGRGPRSPVHAFPSELQAWLLRMGHNSPEITQSPGHGGLHPDGAVATSRVLVNRSTSLVRQLMQSMWAQRQRAEELMQAMEHVSRTMQDRMLNGSRRPRLQRFQSQGRPQGGTQSTSTRAPKRTSKPRRDGSN